MTDRGEPVTIVGSTRREFGGAGVARSDLAHFLLDSGFSELDCHFERGEIESIFGPEKGIEISVGVEGQEVTRTVDESTGLHHLSSCLRRQDPPIRRESYATRGPGADSLNRTEVASATLFLAASPPEIERGAERESSHGESVVAVEMES